MDTGLVESLFLRGNHGAVAIDWCERNYEFSPLIAELFNALSSLAFVVGGLHSLSEACRLRLPCILHAAGIFCILTGLGSFAFHATLQLGWQRTDEACENVVVLLLLHFFLGGGAGRVESCGANALAASHAVGSTIGVLFISAFLFTECHLIGTAILTAWQSSKLRLPVLTRDAAAGGLYGARLRVAVLAIIAGALCWLVDRTMCSSVSTILLGGNPQLHAFWHLFGAVALHEIASCAAIAHLVLARSDGTAGRIRVHPFLCGLVTSVEYVAEDGKHLRKD